MPEAPFNGVANPPLPMVPLPLPPGTKPPQLVESKAPVAVEPVQYWLAVVVPVVVNDCRTEPSMRSNL